MTILLEEIPIKARAAVEELLNKSQRLEMENCLMRERIRLLLLKKYGCKNESLSEGQLQLLEVEPGISQPEVEKEAALPEQEKRVPRKKASKHPGREKLPEHLERRVEIIAVEAAERMCPCCGKERQLISYEEKEVLDMEMVKYFVRLIKREKLACKCCEEGGVATAAAGGPKIIEKGKLSDSVVVDVLINKYCAHLPLYRQEEILARDFNLEVSRNTLCDAIMRAGNLLQPVRDAMRRELLAGDYIQADETPIGVQVHNGRGHNHQAYAFEYSRPGGNVVFDFRMTRAREGPLKFLEKFNGVLQYDGYAGYEKTGGKTLIRVGCWAHARRKFHEASRLDPKNADAMTMLDLIGELYAVEKEAREAAMKSEARLSLRCEKSLPLLKNIRSKVSEIRGRVLPAGAMGKACNYLLNQWHKLTPFCEHGIVEIDNNWCENAIRPIALGRKNWLHIGSEKAGPRIAAILSVIETCKRLDISPREYLLDVLPKLPEWKITRVGELTPEKWLTSHTGKRQVCV